MPLPATLVKKKEATARPLPLGARTFLGAPGIATSHKKLIVAKGIATNGAFGRFERGLQPLPLHRTSATSGLPPKSSGLKPERRR